MRVVTGDLAMARHLRRHLATEPGAQITPLRVELLHGPEGVLSLAARLDRKVALLPVGLIQAIVLVGIEPGARLQHQHLEAPCRKSPGCRATTGPRPHHNHVMHCLAPDSHPGLGAGCAARWTALRAGAGAPAACRAALR